MISRLFYLLIAGGIGGLIAWAIQEPFFMQAQTNGNPAAEIRQTLILGLAIGSFIGCFIGAATGWNMGSWSHVGRGALICGILGGIGGLIGLYFAGQVFMGLHGREDAQIYHIHQHIIRGLTFMVWGAFIGFSQGGAFINLTPAGMERGWKRAVQGAIGGAIGGFIGGFLFNIIATVTVPLQYAIDPSKFGPTGRGTSEVGIFSRAISFTLLGAAIGFFIGLVEYYARQAWVKVLAGKNEGKEYLVEASETIIGRSETADIPLFGDKAIAPIHAVIRNISGNYTLVNATAPGGTFLNNQPIAQSPLNDGDQIRVGAKLLVFRLKDKKAKQKIQSPANIQQQPIGVQPGVCPYCGIHKDPMGNCGCSVPGAVQAGTQTYQQPYPPNQTQGYTQQMPPMAPLGQTQPMYPQQPMGTGIMVAYAGPHVGMRIIASPMGVVIGRDPGNQAALSSDSKVSRQHARLVLENNIPVLIDDGSTNGTYVNNMRITRQPLKTGDIVRIGNTEFRVE